MSQQLVKIALIEELVGKDAPLASKVRAYLAMGNHQADKNQIHKMAMQALNLANQGFGWDTLVREHVAGPGSPFVEVSIGHLIDRYELIWFTSLNDDSHVAG